MRPYCTGGGELGSRGKMLRVRGRGACAPARAERPRGGGSPRSPRHVPPAPAVLPPNFSLPSRGSS